MQQGLAVDPNTAASARNYPSVSLLVPLAGDTPWRARLAQLRRSAEDRLRAEFGNAVDPRLISRLQEAVDGAEAPRDARSVAVYVNSVVSHSVGLDVEVRERAVVDDTFATRDLVADELRAPRYWVLALSLDTPMLLRGEGERLKVVPLELRDTHPHPSDQRARLGRDRSDIVEARRVRRLRAIDDAITEPLGTDAEPLLVVGAEPTLSRFLERSHHVTRVEGVLRRAPQRDVGRLAETIRPLVLHMLTERRLLALDALDRAVGARTLASGIEPVWRAARRSPGVLLVEQSYEQPVRLLLGDAITPTDDATAADVIDDAVDEIIEVVLAQGGRIELLQDGDLVDHQRIAFLPHTRLRHRAR